MEFVEKMVFKNARATFFSSKVGQDNFWVGLSFILGGCPRVMSCKFQS